MVLDNEQIVRQAYQIAEEKDLKGWVDAFTADGTFTDYSIGVVYRGPDGPNGLPVQVENYARAFPDMHRELYRLYDSGNIVVVQLALQGTHLGPLTCPRDAAADRQADGRAVLRRLRARRRQDKTLRLLPQGSVDPDPARRARQPRRRARALTGHGEHRVPATTSHLPGDTLGEGPPLITARKIHAIR